MTPLPSIAVPELGPDLLRAAPLLVVFGAALAVLLTGASRRGRGRRAAFLLAIGSLALAAALTVPLLLEPGGPAFSGAARLDRFSGLVLLLLVLCTAATAALSPSLLEAVDARIPEHDALLLLSLTGMSLLVVAHDLLLAFVGLEIVTVAAWALTGLNRSEAAGVEAAVRTFVLAAFSSALLLYGVAFVYGAAGGTGYAEVASAAGEGRILQVGLAMVLVGFCFKVGAVPFHPWVPDVVQGAPAPASALFATAVKVAAFAALIRFAAAVLPTAGGAWGLALAIMAAASMLVGAAAAFVQRDLKRFLGWSAVSHTGFVLVPVAGLGTSRGAPDLHGALFYLAAYAVASLGVFALVAAMTSEGREDPDMQRLKGLGRRHPWIAAGLGICLLSLAGLPLTAGFPAKVYVLLAAFQNDRGWLAVVVVLAALAGAAYALKPLVLLLEAPGEEAPVHVGFAGRVVLAAAVAGVVGLGVLPGPFADLCRLALAGLGR